MYIFFIEIFFLYNLRIHILDRLIETTDLETSVLKDLGVIYEHQVLHIYIFFFKFFYFTRHKISITNTCLHFTSGQPKLIIITINHCIAIDLI